MAAPTMDQMIDELNVARTQVARLAADQDALRASASQATANSEARTAALIAQLASRVGQGGAGGGGDRFDIVDFKVMKPDNFYGKREESWKAWSRQFRTYCNVQKEGFKKALDWAEAYQGEIFNEHSIDEMQWPLARVADSKLHDF